MYRPGYPLGRVGARHTCMYPWPIRPLLKKNEYFFELGPVPPSGIQFGWVHFWGGGRAGINKNVTDTKRDTRGVITDLGGGQDRNKQKRYKFRYRRGVTTDLGGGQGRNKQKRYRHKT